MTMWELAASIDGFNLANGGELPLEPPSNDEFDAMLERRTVH
jgi:hypothetical protein